MEKVVNYDFNHGLIRLKEDAYFVLRTVGFPRGRCFSDMASLTFLAFCGIVPPQRWGQIEPRMITITQAMEFMATHYGATYRPNTRESVRLSVVGPLRELGVLVANPDGERPPQSPRFCYQLSPHVTELLRILQ